MLGQVIHKTGNLEEAISLTGTIRNRFPTASIETSREDELMVIRAAGMNEKLTAFAQGFIAGRESAKPSGERFEAGLQRVMSERDELADGDDVDAMLSDLSRPDRYEFEPNLIG